MLGRAADAVDLATAVRDEAAAAVLGHIERHDQATQELERLDNAIDDARRRADNLGSDVKGMAIDRFTSGSSLETSLLADNREFEIESRSDVLSTEALSTSVARLRATQAELAELGVARANQVTTIDGIAADIEAAQANLAEAESMLEEALAHQREVKELLDNPRSYTALAGSDIGLVALEAYWQAARALADSKPTCKLDWWGLAGVGKVESGHGTFGGAVVLAGGQVSVPIVGIPLDGQQPAPG